MKQREGGGANLARYCYSVWLRHLVLAHRHGMQNIPRVVAELGPGDSLGIGMAALLSGCERYHAFDVVHFIRHKQNFTMLEELIELFQQRAPIPDEQEFPHLYPRLADYAFPSEILHDHALHDALAPDRVETIRDALSSLGNGEKQIVIFYSVPWDSSTAIQEESVDMIISQAVLEHVDRLADAYAFMYRWLRPGGFISHEIDFKSHGISQIWNGHWSYGNLVWRIIRGKRAYLLNREPCSTHEKYAKHAGFIIDYIQREYQSNGVAREQLPPLYRGLSGDDLITSSAYFFANKGKHGTQNS
ncbi:MAG: methyltransferase domain-containing protein [Thermodesulfovibrionales bacterium]